MYPFRDGRKPSRALLARQLSIPCSASYSRKLYRPGFFILFSFVFSFPSKKILESHHLTQHKTRSLFLGGVAIFGFIAIGLDIAFFATFIAILVLARDGASRCTGIVDTPLGRGPSNQDAPGAGDFGYVCSLNTAAFAVAVICMLLFLVTAPMQFILVKHHRKEKGLA